jgi:hypothetical protein
MYLMEIRQLARVQWTFASASSGFSPITGESLIGEVSDPRYVYEHSAAPLSNKTFSYLIMNLQWYFKQQHEFW